MLYIVATPIGNLSDITFRAIEVLKKCDIVIAEDSRRASILLREYNIGRKTLEVYNEYNEKKKTGKIISLLQQGKTAALTSDAGTPGISDPGYLLVRDAAAKGIHITSVPGPCAAVNALVCSGLPATDVEYTGFLPRKKGKRKTFFQNIKKTAVFFESPHRIIGTLEIMAETIPDMHIVLAREMTKKHEEFIRGTVREVYAAVREKPGLKGEITIVVHRPRNI